MAGVSASAYAPAVVGNVASGFDLVGHCVDGMGDVVTATRVASNRPRPRARIQSVTGRVTDLPTAPEANTASRAAIALLEAAGADFDVELTLNKGIPLSSGLGGSAASATAAVVATNALLDAPRSTTDLYPFAVVGETVATGQPVGDNVGPQLMGGLVLATEQRLIQLPTPSGLTALVIHPSLLIETSQARACLAAPFGLDDITRQQTSLAQLIIGLYTDDASAIAGGLVDHLVEPRRRHLIPGFEAFKTAAKAHGALGASISGAGPSVFAWFASLAQAKHAQLALSQPFHEAGLTTEALLTPVNAAGARLVETPAQ